MVAVDLALDASEQYAGVVALSGFVMCVEDWARKLQSKKGLRVLQLHGPRPGVSLFASRRRRGGRDATDAGLEDRTIPYYTAPWLRDLLQTNGAQVTFLPHAAGHECGPASASAILAFLAGLF